MSKIIAIALIALSLMQFYKAMGVIDSASHTGYFLQQVCPADFNTEYTRKASASEIEMCGIVTRRVDRLSSNASDFIIWLVITGVAYLGVAIALLIRRPSRGAS